MFATYDEAIAFLFSRTNYEAAPPAYDQVHYDVGRMARLAELLGDPHAGLRAAHVAGTKGKGSVAHMIDSCLRAAGYRTGLYISPHIQDLEERISVDGRPISRDRMKALIEAVKPAFDTLQSEERAPTFFELMTAMAFVEFRSVPVDAAAVEVGMGGRFDSTNVLSPAVTVITTISLDHVAQLGGTLASIAREKAGILKPGVPAVIGDLPAEALDVVTARANEAGAPTLLFGRDVSFDRVGSSRCVLHLAGGDIDDVAVALSGDHQLHNAALGAAACRVLASCGLDGLTDEAIRTGLATTRAPGRFEQLSEGPVVIADGAHNVASAQVLVQTLRDRWPGKGVWFIFGCLEGHDAKGFLRAIAGFSRGIITTPIRSPRTYSAEDLGRLAREAGSRDVVEAGDPEAALAAARKLSDKDEIICATGSFYLVGEIRGLLPG